MSAVILAFPCRAFVGDNRQRGDSLCTGSSPQAFKVASGRPDFLVTGHHLPPFSAAWCIQHLPLIEAGLELLEADDEDFAQRCAAMRDADGRAMLDELAGQLQRLSTHIADVADALGLTAARIRDAMIVTTAGTSDSY